MESSSEIASHGDLASDGGKAYASPVVVCASCGQENPEGFRFCGACAAPLGDATPAREERKVITVLFCDLVGSTAEGERLDPEDFQALLSGYHQGVRAELERFGGTVEKFIGDAVVALFGVPVAHEDDPERAVRAALAVQEWVSEQPDLHVRMAVNTGEALVLLGARAAQGEHVASGDVLNTAARLQAAAPVDGILVGERTFRATERAIKFVEAAPVPAKGKSRPVLVWRALGTRSRASVERVHGAALVGRRREVDLLVGALGRVRQERSPELVTLVGVPGIGKSRLVLELYDRVERETDLTSWRHGRCLPYGEGVTFWALGEMVKAEAGILEDDEEAETERKLRAVVDDPWVESHLRPLVGLAGGVEGGGDRRDEAFTAWRRFFEGLADRRPLVLVFEDLQWADEDLLDFVDHLVDWASGVPLLLVCTTRPELLARRPGWGGGKSNTLTISLSPLSDTETAQLLGALLERPVLPADTQADLLVRAGGNPLYAEEYARALREGGEVERLPETVQGMIAARLDLLDPAEKSLVQNAAVVGKTFWLGAVALLADGDRAQFEKRLHALERKEFVRRERSTSVAGDAEYSFRHLLFRDVAYAQIPRAERAERHLLAAGWLERLGRPDDHAEMLAHHYLQALELGAAAGIDTHAFAAAAGTALADAGERALALNAYGAAARYFRAALEIGVGERGRLMLKLGRARLLLGEDAVPMLLEARDELLAAGDVDAAAEAERELALEFWVRGERDPAWQHLGMARQLVEQLGPSPVKAMTIAAAARLQMLANENDEAIRLGQEAIAMAEELGLGEVRAAALNNVGTARSLTGDDGGLADLAEAIRVAEGANAASEVLRAKGNLAVQLWISGRLEESIALWREAGGDAARYGQLGFSRWMRGVVVHPLWSVGAWDEALAAADRFIAEVEAGAPHYLAGPCYVGRALIRLARDDKGGALEDAREAVERAARAGDPQVLLPTHAWAAHVCLDSGDEERAAAFVDDYVAALRVQASIGFSVTTAHVAAGTLAALGRSDEVVAALARYPQPWARAAHACAVGDLVQAAEILAATGAAADAAMFRLASARAGIDAERQAEQALAFYRSVGARRYVRECESLLGAAAAG
jgi:class 3 adenylate cyclase